MAAKALLRTVGREIRALREAKSLSQEALAERAGLHRNFIGLIERGQRNPTLITLADLAEALNTPLADLIAGAVKKLG